jgi:hypothetical protein
MSATLRHCKSAPPAILSAPPTIAPEPAPEPAPDPSSSLEETMSYYEKLWNTIPAGTKGMSQTETYATTVPIEPVDCTQEFTAQGLNQVFTCDRFSMKMMGPTYNCNMLGRQSAMTPDVLVYHHKNFTVLHPLGKPGLALGADNAFKAAHMMIVAQSGSTFNELLPSTPEEITSLGERLAMGAVVTDKMKTNAPLSECGSKVIAKAKDMNIPITTGIRDFVQLQISAMPDELREGRPGYLLEDENGVDIAKNSAKITEMLTAAFTGKLELKIYIQGPDKNTQAQSHQHMFMLDPDADIPGDVARDYHDVHEIYKIKLKMADMDA